jgi:hypothetical protein
VLNPTPAHLLLDAKGRPYFLWDCELTLEQFRARLTDPDPEVRAYLIAKLMRQAKPDDVFTFVSLSEVRAHWSRVEPQLGDTRAFWTWLLELWKEPGFVVDALQAAPAFQRLRVSDGRDVCLVDLVAEPVPALEVSRAFDVEWERIEVDSAHEILVNKLCTLLHRSEPRDLVDVEALLASGGELGRALAEAPSKDGGFSPLTLAWILRDLRVEAAALALGFDADRTRALLAFRERLAVEVARLAEPGSSVESR